MRHQICYHCGHDFLNDCELCYNPDCSHGLRLDPSAPKPMGEHATSHASDMITSKPSQGEPFQKAATFFYDGMMTKTCEALLNQNDELKREIESLKASFKNLHERLHTERQAAAQNRKIEVDQLKSQRDRYRVALERVDGIRAPEGKSQGPYDFENIFCIAREALKDGRS